jgi:hypothetical protein
MRRRDFQRDEMSLSSIRLEDLRRAEAEEEAHHPLSNENVKTLEQHVYAVGGRVMGSRNSRSGYRSQIWSMSLKLGPPSLWITINPLDYERVFWGCGGTRKRITAYPHACVVDGCP